MTAHNFAKFDEGLVSFRPLLVTASLPVVAAACLIVHACVPTGVVAEMFVILIILGWQVSLVTCFESKNIVVFSIMLASLLLKVALGWLQLRTAQWGASDQLMYFDQGSRIAATSSTFQEVFTLKQMWGIDSGTEFIISATAILFKLIGPSMLIATMVFSLVGYWGQYLYYLTFQEVFPRADSRVAALGLFLWPSIVFWSAELGKDALMLFSLGLSSYCIAVLSKRKTSKRFILLGIGSLGAFVVRPHIAALLVISMATSFSLVAPTAKAALSPRRLFKVLLLCCFSFSVVYICAQFLQLTDLAETMSRVDASVRSNQLDGSGFNPGATLASRVVLAPLLLIRPYPWETNGISATLVSAEGILLLALAFYRQKKLRSLLKISITNGPLAFLVWFVLLNVVLLGIGTSNFGLLARQRVMVLPIIVMLLAACSPARQDCCSLRLASKNL